MASEEEMFLLAVYVDDIVLAKQKKVHVKQELSRKFQVKDMGV